MVTLDSAHAYLEKPLDLTLTLRTDVFISHALDLCNIYYHHSVLLWVFVSFSVFLCFPLSFSSHFLLSVSEALRFMYILCIFAVLTESSSLSLYVFLCRSVSSLSKAVKLVEVSARRTERHTDTQTDSYCKWWWRVAVSNKDSSCCDAAGWQEITVTVGERHSHTHTHSNTHTLLL